MASRPHNHTLTKRTPPQVEEVASPQDWVQITPMVMDSRGEIMAHPRAPAKTTERVEMVEVVVATEVAAAAAATVVTQTGGLFTPAAAKAPVRMGDAPKNRGIRRKSSSVRPCLLAWGSELGKIPCTKI